jgi:hypothetical protein
MRLSLTASSTLPKRTIALSQALKQITTRLIRILCPEQAIATANPELKPRFMLWGPHFQTDIGKYSNILSFQKKVVLPLKIYGLERTWGLLWGYRLRGKRYMSWHSRKLICLAATRILCAHDGLTATRFSKMQDGKIIESNMMFDKLGLLQQLGVERIPLFWYLRWL